MGNTLIKSDNVKILKNDTILEKEINKILRERTEIFEKIDGQYLEEPINQIRACCMDVVKKEPTDKDFITIKLPKATDDKQCTENCLSTEKFGLQFKGEKMELCGNKLVKGRGGACDGWMVNSCAKELYDNDCVTIEKDKESGKYYKKWNKKCLDKEGNINYIRDDCACLNSVTGYNLNMDPSVKIKGGFLFDKLNENPYGLKGNVKNNFTKYSVNMFNVPYKNQQPKLFDKKCISKEVDVKKGLSGAYSLPNYDDTENKLCLKELDIGELDKKTFSNIEQNTNCNCESIKFKNSDRSTFDLVGDKSINKKYSYRILKEAKSIINTKKSLKGKVQKIRKDKVDDKSLARIKQIEAKKEYIKKLRSQRTNSIKSQAKLKRQIDERSGEITFLKGSIVEQENEISDLESKIGFLNAEKTQILSVMDELKNELDEKNKKEKEALLRAEMAKNETDEEVDGEVDSEVDDELIEEEQKKNLYVSMGYLIFILVVIVVFYNMNHTPENYEE